MSFITKLLSKQKKETARQTYIRLLHQRIGAIDTLNEQERGHFLWAELIAAGYLNGTTQENGYGVPVGNIIFGPTVAGRLFLQEMEAKEHSGSVGGKLKKWGWVGAGFLCGIISAILVEFLKKELRLLRIDGRRIE